MNMKTEEFLKLREIANANDGYKSEIALSKLLNQYTPMAYSIAWQYYGQWMCGSFQDDIKQLCKIGVWNGIRDYKEDFKTSPSTLIYFRVISILQDNIPSLIHGVSVHTAKTGYKIYKFVVAYENEHDGKSPTIDEISDGTGISRAIVSQTLNSSMTGNLSFDSEEFMAQEELGGTERFSTLNPEKIAISREFMEIIGKAINNENERYRLNDKERLVLLYKLELISLPEVEELTGYQFKKGTLSELAKALKLKNETEVICIYRKAIRKIRNVPEVKRYAPVKKKTSYFYKDDGETDFMIG